MPKIVVTGDLSLKLTSALSGQINFYGEKYGHGNKTELSFSTSLIM